MKFADVEVGKIFFEDVTGEYYKKLNDRESVVISIHTKEEYHDLITVFPKTQTVEEPEE